MLRVAGVRILGYFARLPFHYCSRLPNVKVPQLLAAGKLKGLPAAQAVIYDHCVLTGEFAPDTKTTL